jgi:hypothetical protein
MDSKVKSIEKLFNTLGKQMAKEYYGLDLNFEVTSIEEENQFHLTSKINSKRIGSTEDLPQKPTFWVIYLIFSDMLV